MCAKSKSFFGLRTGSTKSHTFSVLRGEQITKERVAQVANPQSINQGIQRSRFAAAAKFYRELKFILDHSTEGVSYGTMNQAAFMARAIDTGWGISLSKGAAAFPFNYPISVGSLSTLTVAGRSHTRFQTIIRYPAGREISHDDFLIQNNFQEGDNLTVVIWAEDKACAITFTLSVGNLAEPEDGFANYWASRIEGSLPQSLLSKITTSHSRLWLLDVLEPQTLGMRSFVDVQNGCVIHSRDVNGKWLRSSEWFYLAEVDPSDDSGAKSYTKAGAAGATLESDYQLDETESNVEMDSKILFSKTITVPSGEEGASETLRLLYRTEAKLIVQKDTVTGEMKLVLPYTKIGDKNVLLQNYGGIYRPVQVDAEALQALGYTQFNEDFLRVGIGDITSDLSGYTQVFIIPSRVGDNPLIIDFYDIEEVENA